MFLVGKKSIYRLEMVLEFLVACKIFKVSKKYIYKKKSKEHIWVVSIAPIYYISKYQFRAIKLNCELTKTSKMAVVFPGKFLLFQKFQLCFPGNGMELLYPFFLAIFSVNLLVSLWMVFGLWLQQNAKIAFVVFCFYF